MGVPKSFASNEKFRSAGLCFCIFVSGLVLFHVFFLVSWESHSTHTQREIRSEFLESIGQPSSTPSSNALQASKPVQVYSRTHVHPDTSIRCKTSGICDGNTTCGDDKLGCITDAAQRRAHVVEAAKWSWDGYKKYAWGKDELLTSSHQGHDWFGLGLTIVDSLDTLLVVGLNDEFKDGREWVEKSLSFDGGALEISTFETTIRILGGLLSTYYLSNDDMFLKKAQEFGDRLLPAFKAHDGIAQPFFRLSSGMGRDYPWGGTNLAEAGTLSMEFSALSELTGDPKYRNAAMQFWSKLNQLPNIDGLYCSKFNGNTMQCIDKRYQFGGEADSMYEYMLKQWVLSGGKDKECLELYKAAMKGMRKHLVKQVHVTGDPEPSWIFAEGVEMNGVINQVLTLNHLTCFAPGMLALGHMHGLNTANSPSEPNDLQLAQLFMKACYDLYTRTPSGVGADGMEYHLASQNSNTNVNDALITNNPAGVSSESTEQELEGWKKKYAGPEYSTTPHRENLLRPEVVESLMYLYRATGDATYQDWGWSMLRAFNKYSRQEGGGYAIIGDVTRVPPVAGDKMESFWIAEAVKYFYLLFSEEDVPLDAWVFNTEAHPLLIRGADNQWRNAGGAGGGSKKGSGGSAKSSAKGGVSSEGVYKKGGGGSAKGGVSSEGANKKGGGGSYKGGVGRKVDPGMGVGEKGGVIKKGGEVFSLHIT